MQYTGLVFTAFYFFRIVTSPNKAFQFLSVQFISVPLLVLEMKVMVKEARRFSSDVEYPENTKQGDDGSAKIRLPQGLFGKYKGRKFFASITFDY